MKRLGLVWIALVWSTIGVAPAAIRFQNFASARGLKLVGDATVPRDKVLRLTPARQNRAGAAWIVEKQPVAAGFETTFEFRLTRQGGLGPGADGFAFVLQNSGPSALGGRGSAGGFAVADAYFHPRQPGIPWSIAVFFDTFQNVDEKDPSSNYVAVCTHGKPAEMRWPAERLDFTPNLRVQLKDRKAHRARIRFRAPILSVFLDDSDEPVLETRVDLSVVMDSQGRAWVGFTASTGGGYENHDILNWSFTQADVSSSISMVSSEISFLMSACLPGRNLCTPEHPVIEPTGAGYHVILPANLAWGASIPNPREGAVEFANARGISCWEVKAQGSSGCGGPFENTEPAGDVFLAPGAGAGALIVRTREGKTWFSVNGHRDGFQNNEGFYEFDVEVKKEAR